MDFQHAMIILDGLFVDNYLSGICNATSALFLAMLL